MRLAQFDTARVTKLFDEMEEEATRVVRSCGWAGAIHAEYKIYMRYAGQGWEIPVTLTPEEARAADPAVILKRFEHEYANLFGRTVKGLAAEITVWSVNAHTPQEAVSPVAPLAGTREAPAEGSRSVFDAGLGKRVEAESHSRTALPAGSRINGPGIVTEDETTIIVPSSRTGVTLNDGCIDIRLTEARPAASVAERKEPAHV
jgi:N-methylhydantoinase A